MPGSFLTQLTIVACCTIFGMALELFWRSRGSLLAKSARFNLAYTAFYWTFQVTIGAAFAVAVATVTSYVPGHGLLRLPISAAPSVLEVALVAAMWVAAHDFSYYWFHRWQHTSRWLWAQHELHHADESMNVTTTLRHHWTEMPLQLVFAVAPIAYLVAPPPDITFAAGALAQAMAYFIHLDVKVGLGRWSWLIANPQTHRIHHSKAEAHIDKNFAGVFPVWDVLFGTFYQPAKQEYPDTGIASQTRPLTFWDAVVLPFRKWATMIAAIRPKDSRT